MKRFILGLSIFLTFSPAFSQKLYFIYLQSEPAQAFYVKMNDKVHSSSSSGYLILSRLRDSTYTISVGFPQNKWPEQKFTINIKSKDQGYLLKNFGEKGWGLYDIETMAIQMASLDNGNSKVKTEPKDVSVFTDILSKAANDPSLKEKPVMIKDEKPATSPPLTVKEDVNPVKETPKQDQPPVIKKDEQPVVVKEDPVIKKEDVKSIPAAEYKKSVITRMSESSVAEGLSVTFLDDYGNGKKDTIRIIIPGPPKDLAEIKEKPKEEKKFLDITTNDTAKEKTPGTEPAKSGITPVSKSNCIAIASESDFLKLRKKMAAETKDEAMVDEAKKYFRTKCFTVLQVKNIGNLFLNDAGKYKFFDAAYEYVSDQENFSSLVAELKDEYYINRFKAMLR